MPSPRSAAIRAARRRDLPAIYDVLEQAFTDAPISLFVAQTEGDSTLRMRHARVAVDGGRVVAHVRIFARRMLVRGVPVAAGGIGSVASHPDARGGGLPTALLRDAIDVMRSDNVPVSFLFTGIPQFYERVGYRTVREPSFVADAGEVASIAHDGGYALRAIDGDDTPALLTLYRRATAGTTGAIVRTARTWRDAQAWLAEDAAAPLVAEWNGRTVAYMRARDRDYGYHLLEAEHAPGHAAAIAPLLAAAGRRAVALGRSVVTVAPAGHALAVALRSLPSTRETDDVRYPMMMRIISLRALIDALLPHLASRADTHRGAAFSLGLRAPGDSLTLDVRGATARIGRGMPQYTLDEGATLDALLGQRRAGALLRPRAPAEVRRRVDALLPETPLHFWNSDRI